MNKKAMTKFDYHFLFLSFNDEQQERQGFNIHNIILQ